MSYNKSKIIGFFVDITRNCGINACENKALQLYDKNSPTILNIGGGKNKRHNNSVCYDAQFDYDIDFNTKKLYIQSCYADVVICEQVIEHLHNTTFFISELFRILKPKGKLIISTENLASFPNIFALILQKTPFSLQATCGNFVGGWKDGPAGDYDEKIKENHPTFSGVRGHVRVMTTNQLKILLKMAGFHIVSKYGYAFNHYILLECIKP